MDSLAYCLLQSVMVSRWPLVLSFGHRRYILDYCFFGRPLTRRVVRSLSNSSLVNIHVPPICLAGVALPAAMSLRTRESVIDNSCATS